MDVLRTSVSGIYRTTPEKKETNLSLFCTFIFGNKNNKASELAIKYEDCLNKIGLSLSVESVINNNKKIRPIYGRITDRPKTSTKIKGRCLLDLFFESFNITDYFLNYHAEGSCMILSNISLTTASVSSTMSERYYAGTASILFTHESDCIMFKLNFPGETFWLGK